MRLLCVETSSPRGSLALTEVSEGRPLGLLETSWEKQSSHSEVITLAFDRLLQQKLWPLESLTHIAVGIGPGSFTGIRVGLNFAKSLAYALGLPILGVDSLDILAAATRNDTRPTLCIINAFKNQVFASSYEAGKKTKDSGVIEPRELKAWITRPHLCLGDAYEIYRDELDPQVLPQLVRETAHPDVPTAGNLALHIARDVSPESFTDWKNVNPLYIRPSSAEEKLKGGALKPSLRF